MMLRRLRSCIALLLCAALLSGFVLSLGAGGITKLVEPATGKIERLNNPKYPKEYLENAES